MIRRFEDVQVIIISTENVRVKYVENKRGSRTEHDDAFQSTSTAERFAEWLRRQISDGVPSFY